LSYGCVFKIFIYKCVFLKKKEKKKKRKKEKKKKRKKLI